MIMVDMGTDDDWNKLPVCGGENKSYKVFGSSNQKKI